MKVHRIVIILSIILIVLAGCKKDKKEVKSMEDLYKEQGIPVKVETVKTSSFSKNITFFAEMEGYKQTTVYNKAADYVKKINANIGDYVKKDAVIVEFPKDSHSSQYVQAKAQYENLEKMYNRMKSLFEAGSIARQDLDDVETQYIVAKENYKTLKSMTDVVAPYNGVITEFFMKKTEFVDVDLPLFTISDLTKLKAVIWITEDNIDFFKKGLNVKAVWKSHEISGKVTEVALAMDKTHKAFRAVAVFDNPGTEIKGGVTAEINLEVYRNDTAVVVSSENVKNISVKPMVWINNNGVAQKRPVTIANVSGSNLEIGSGLSAGESLVVEGLELIYDKAKLNIQD